MELQILSFRNTGSVQLHPTIKERQPKGKKRGICSTRVCAEKGFFLARRHVERWGQSEVLKREGGKGGNPYHNNALSLEKGSCISSFNRPSTKRVSPTKGREQYGREKEGGFSSRVREGKPARWHFFPRRFSLREKRERGVCFHQ